MADQTQLAWTATPTAFTVTALHSLATTNLWNSGVVASGSPTDMIIQIGYRLETATALAAGEYIAFWIVGHDDGTTAYWPGNVSESAGAITTAGPKGDLLGAIGQPHHIHPFATGNTVVLMGSFMAYNFSPDWQLIIQTVGKSLHASSNVVRYRYATPQIVSV